MGKQSWKPGNMLNPVPAVMVSCADREGKPNIITIAWAGTVCTNPPMVSISVRPTRYSYDMIRETGEFVINLVRFDHYPDIHCDEQGGAEHNDRLIRRMLAEGGEALKVEGVSVPGIAESPVSIACRVVEERALGSHTMFLAEVVGVTTDDRYLDETGRFDINGTGLIMYSHGEYFGLGRKLGKFGYSVQKKPKRRRK